MAYYSNSACHADDTGVGLFYGGLVNVTGAVAVTVYTFEVTSILPELNE